MHNKEVLEQIAVELPVEKKEAVTASMPQMAPMQRAKRQFGARRSLTLIGPETVETDCYHFSLSVCLPVMAVLGWARCVGPAGPS